MTQNPARWHRSRLLGLGGILALSCCLGVTGTMCPFGGVTVDDPAAPPGSGNSGLTGKYVGAERCSQCHARVHEMWGETLHAKALETLEAIGQGSNAACLGCHPLRGTPRRWCEANSGHPCKTVEDFPSVKGMEPLVLTEHLGSNPLTGPTGPERAKSRPTIVQVLCHAPRGPEIAGLVVSGAGFPL